MFKKWFGGSSDKKPAENASSIEAQAENQLETQDENQVEVQAENQVEAQAENQLETQAENQVEAPVENQFEVQVEDVFEFQTENQFEVLSKRQPVIQEAIPSEALAEAIEEETMEASVEMTEREPIESEVGPKGEMPVETPSAKGFFERLKSGLSKTSKAITDRIDLLLGDYGKIDEELYEELEEIMITADIGMETTVSLIDKLRAALVERRISDASLVKGVLRDVMVDTLKEHSNPHLNLDRSPSILLVIGVNGAGKTTTIGKIAHRLKAEGKTVMLAAADTFRAAAIDQLKIWGERSGVPVISQQEGSDPAAVVYDAIQAAKARKIDVLICDTAGRLHNKKNLMNELAKIFRVIERDFPEAEREVMLVLDATTGQNGLQQAKIFKEVASITSIALTKLDGTAKGGVVLSILHEVEIPVKLIGVGEGLNDLQPFDPEKFVDALLDLK